MQKAPTFQLSWDQALRSEQADPLLTNVDRSFLKKITPEPVAFAMEGCTGWRYIAEEMAKAGVTPHLAEPAETSGLRGPKRRAKTTRPTRSCCGELLATGRLPACYIRPPQVLEWRVNGRRGCP